MNAFDGLEHQLRESVRQRRPRRAVWRRPRLLLALVPVVTLAGGAGASGLLGGPGVASRANAVAHEIEDATARDGACRRNRMSRNGAATFSDARPLPEVLRAFPSLGHPPQHSVTDALLVEAGKAAGGAPVLRSTVRLATFADGARLLFLVTSSGGFFGVADPAACAAQRLGALQGRADGLDPAVRDQVEERLRSAVDTDPAAQSYIVSTTRIRPDGTGGGGGGSPVRPGHPIRVRGAWGSGPGGFYGIAHRQATVVRVVRVRPGRRARDWRGPGAYRTRVRVREGLFAFIGRTTGSGSARVGHGRYRVTQYDRDGRVVDRTVLPR